MKLVENLEGEEGASSVLVIFMMIVLVSLGAFSITSAHVNYSLSQRAVSWNKEFFQMDSLAERFLQGLDMALSQAEIKTAQYVLGNGFEQAEYEGVPANLQRQFRQMGSFNKESAERGLNLLYTNYAYETLKSLSLEYPGIILGENLEYVEINFTMKEDEELNLLLKLEILPLQFDVDAHGRFICADRKAGAKRFEIRQWRQWQTPQNMNESQELWDGIPR
ncbi:MAG: hypothetical protein LBU32_25845 [Clostridiales bacterium]|nr:hypothetical protein [Clostridiales bacterium]